MDVWRGQFLSGINIKSIKTKDFVFQIPASRNLNHWYPCFEDFLCAVLDVSPGN